MGLFGPPNIIKMEAKRDVEGLIKALRYRRDKKDEYRHVAQAAADALGYIGDVRAIEPLIVALEVSHLGENALSALRKFGALTVEPLITALKHNKYYVRKGAATLLGNIGDVRAVEPLIAAFKEISRTFRDDVMNRRARGKVETIIQSVTPGDDTWSVWKYPLNAAAEALVTLGDFRAIEPLFAVLDDLDDKVRAGARALRQSLGVHAVEAHQTTLEQLDQAERANDLYVNECFTIEFPETRENRQLLDTAEAQPMIAAQHSGALADSLLHAQRLVMRYPDCHSFYYWQGYLHAELGHLGQSRAILLEGIQKSREKASLYDRLARTEWQSGDLQEAVKWWIRSMVVRTETRNFDDSDPFLYLSYVAEGLGLSDASAKLSQKSKTSLGSEAAAKLRNAAVSQGTQSMKDAILRACRDLA